MTLAPGDTWALYTDGITEAERSDGAEFGEAGLLEIVKRRSQVSAEQLLEEIVQAVRQFTGGNQQDDITVVVARCLA